MAGGLMQLVAYGAQDVYLTGNPEVTFFQAKYKRHTNFAMENIEQTVNGTAANSGRVSVTVARNGDLVGDMYIELESAIASTITAEAGDCNWVAERAINNVELSIGGQRVDKHYQKWWRLYSELYLDESKKATWGKMTTAAYTGAGTGAVYLPLVFFFNRNPGLYLPLIALQYHEVRIDIRPRVGHSPPSSARPSSRSGPTTSTLTLRSVGVLPRKDTSTSLSRFSTPALTLSPPVVPSRSASPTTTPSRSSCGASPTPRPSLPFGTSPPRTLSPRSSLSPTPTTLTQLPIASSPPRTLVRPSSSRVRYRWVVLRPSPRRLRVPSPPSRSSSTVRTASRSRRESTSTRSKRTTITPAPPTPVSTRTLSPSSPRSISPPALATSLVSITRRSRLLLTRPPPPRCTCSLLTTTSSASNPVWVALPSPTKCPYAVF